MEEKKWKPLGKKHNWIERRQGDIIFDLTVLDANRKIDRFIWNTSKRFKEIVKILKLKYGMNCE